MTNELIVICTRNRAEHVLALVALLNEQGVDIPLMVVDSSDNKSLGEELLLSAQDIDYLHTQQKSLARQRNIALEFARANEVDVVHFLDDDTRPRLGYFTNLTRHLVSTSCGGAGGIVVNQPRPKHIVAKRFFLLYSTKAGVVLRSGRNTIGHYPGRAVRRVDWLPGCCMSYRVSRLSDLEFDSRLNGYSWGEDMDFSFRLSRLHPLEIVPSAEVEHLEAPENRQRAGALARDRTIILHRWIRENAEHGMSVPAFWWSVLGELILRSLDGLHNRGRRRLSFSIARGVLSGSWTIVKSR